MLAGDTSVAAVPIAATEALGSTSPFITVTPNAGHVAGVIRLDFVYNNGATTQASNPFAVDTGPGTLVGASYVQDDATHCHINFNEPVPGATPTVIKDTVASLSASFSNSVIAPTNPSIGVAVQVGITDVAAIAFTVGDNGGAGINAAHATGSLGDNGMSGGSSPILVTVSAGNKGLSQTWTVNVTNSSSLTSGNSLASNAVAVTTIPGAMASVNSVAGNTTATVSGVAGPDLGGLSCTMVADDGTGAHTTAAGASPRIVTGLNNGTPYVPRGKLRNALGDGPYLAGNSVTPQNTVMIPIIYPIFPGETPPGPKIYDVLDADGVVLASGVTSGFVDIGNGVIDNAFRVEVNIAPNGAHGAFAGCARFTGINGSEARLVALNKSPNGLVSSVVICMVAPFPASATASGGGAIVAPGYKIMEFGSSTYGSRITSGITAVSGVANGFIAKITRTLDSDHGTGFTPFFDGG